MNTRFRPAVFLMRRLGTQFAMYGSYFLLFLVFFVALPFIAQASTPRPLEVHKIDFNDTDVAPYRTLDWRSPGTVLTFDIPDNDWVDDVELLLSARPASPVSKTAPIIIRFNDAQPLPIEADGNGFDAQVVLDRMKVRKGRNQVSFEYQVPAGAACLTPGHGAWDIHAQASKMIITTKPQSRALNFADIQNRLSAPATAPKTVTLLAKGSESLKLHALAAQGVARNTPHIPNFRITRGAADLEIIMAPRSELSQWVTDPNILGNQGPSIALGGADPLQIILTGDHDAHVMEAAKIFSNFAIPSSQSRDVTPMRFISTAQTIWAKEQVKGKTKLAKLGALSFEPGWAPRPKPFHFDIADPAASFGRVTLKLQHGSYVDPTSTLTATLNGQTLGQVRLEREKMTAHFNIPRGVLRGLDNELILSPELHPSATTSVCAASRMGPGLVIDPKSSLKIRTDFASDQTDLSRFAASGLPFAKSNAKETHIIVSTHKRVEYETTLKLFAQMGRASKTGWSEARFYNEMTTSFQPETWGSMDDILIIGSNLDLDAEILSGAPKGLRVAMGGTYRHENGVTRTAMRAGQSQPLFASGDIVEGGVAALFRDSVTPERIIGVITQTRGQSFTRAVENLLSGQHWNHLEGSVARWDAETVRLAQTSMSVPTTHSAFKFSSPQLPDISFPEFKRPDVENVKSYIGNGWQNIKSWAGKIIARTRQPSGLDLPASHTDAQNDPLPPVSSDAGIYSPGGTAPLPALTPESTIHTGQDPHTALENTPSPVKRLKLPTLSNPFKKTPEMPENFIPESPSGFTPPRPNLAPTPFDRKLSKVSGSIAKTYAAAATKVTDVMQIMPVAQYRNSPNYESKYLLFAILVIVLLLAGVFISPKTSEPEEYKPKPKTRFGYLG